MERTLVIKSFLLLRHESSILISLGQHSLYFTTLVNQLGILKRTSSKMLAFSDQWRRTVLSGCSRSRNNNAAGSSPSGFVRWLGHRSRQFHDFAKSLRRAAKGSKLSSSFGRQWTRSDRGPRIELRNRSEMSLSMSLIEKALDKSQRWERETESKTMRKRRWRINGLLTIEREPKKGRNGIKVAWA